MHLKIQLCGERQVARAATDINILGRISDDPVLSSNIPVAEVTARQLGAESDAGTGRNAFDTIKTTEDTHGFALTTMADIELWNLVSHNLTSVGNGAGNLEHDVEELTVTTGVATGRVYRLSLIINGMRRQELLRRLTIVGIARGFLAGRGGVEPGVDKLVNVANDAWEAIVLDVGAKVAKGWRLNRFTGGGLVWLRVPLRDLEIGILKGRPGQTKTKLVDGCLVIAAWLARRLFIKVTVVEERTFLIVVLRRTISIVRFIDDVIAIALL